MWDRPFADEDYVCGKEPNAFLVSILPMLEAGTTLCLGESEGRNAVYLASLGFTVLTVTDSPVALAKTEQLAEERRVSLETRLVDWATFEPGVARYENVVSVFCRLPSKLRRRVHAGVVRALRPGGMFVLEAFRGERDDATVDELNDNGGLLSREQLYDEFVGLQWVRVAQIVRELHEGRGHQGQRAMLEVVARKPYEEGPRGTLH
jgi:hypothetical protein